MLATNSLVMRFVRHATLFVDVAGARLLVDPMLSPVDALDPVLNTSVTRRFPTLPLPFDESELALQLARVDGVLLTHCHRDHWDAQAIAILPKDLPILCQPQDRQRVMESGFRQVEPIETLVEWHGITVTRFSGRHGTGELGERMDPVSGYVLRAASTPSLMITGDTIWCRELEDALWLHEPEVIIASAGDPRFLEGDPIGMSAEGVTRICLARPSAQVVAVHMDCVPHCQQTRDELREWLRHEGLLERVNIPSEGAELRF